MQKVKYLLLLIIVVLLGLFIYQNHEYFMDKTSVVLNLGFDEFNSAELPNIVYYIIVFVVGFLLAYILNFSQRYKKRKIIKELNEKIASDKKRIDELESKQVPVEVVEYGNVDSPAEGPNMISVEAEKSRP